jgi:hypothetical protein
MSEIEPEHQGSDEQQGYAPSVHIVPDETASRLRTHVRRHLDVVHND